jgi:pilus assembly protein TadC
VFSYASGGVYALVFALLLGTLAYVGTPIGTGTAAAGTY